MHLWNITFIKETFGLLPVLSVLRLRYVTGRPGAAGQPFYTESMLYRNMAKKESGGGFQSSAGLMRYFDSENDKALKVSPRIVIGLAIGAVITVILLNTFMPM
jgi:preprotein translocase subunit Sec61beta